MAADRMGQHEKMSKHDNEIFMLEKRKMKKHSKIEKRTNRKKGKHGNTMKTMKHEEKETSQNGFFVGTSDPETAKLFFSRLLRTKGRLCFYLFFEPMDSRNLFSGSQKSPEKQFLVVIFSSIFFGGGFLAPRDGQMCV